MYDSAPGESMTRKSVVLLACFVCLAVPGCSDYKVMAKSGIVAPVSTNGTEPLPLAVGLKVSNQDLSEEFSDMGPALASRLAQAHLFKTIVGPASAGEKPDLMIEATFVGRHVKDRSAFSKSFLTGLYLFLPAPAVEFEDRYIADGSIIVTQGGRQVKSYYAGCFVVVKSKLMASHADIRREGVAAATEGLMDRIVAQLYADRAFFAGPRSGSE
jgi:hypothetical protein